MFESEQRGGDAETAEQREFLEVLGEIVAADLTGPALPPDRAAREVALAAELLEVQSEAELEQFLGGVLQRAAGAVGDRAGSGARRVLGHVLKDAAAQVLPTIGHAVGGRPTRGLERVGDRVAGSMLGLELEGLSREDREFEAARAFVRFADTAARTAATTERHPMTAAEIAETAAVTAAQQHLPGLLPALTADAPSGRSGRWVRQGNQIVIHGA
jgi:hypothetical protein